MGQPARHLHPRDGHEAGGQPRSAEGNGGAARAGDLRPSARLTRAMPRPGDTMSDGAARTQRVVEDCRPEAGGWVPRIDRARCEAKNDCVVVCPYDVFEVRRLTADER